jgi:antitoxin component of MazEF toxin-antitoxin module
MAEEIVKNTPAAYLPFKTFMSALESLEQGLPKKLDRTIWRSQSGIVQSQIMMALRFFSLVNEYDEPTPALQRLVDGKEKRKEHVAALLRHAYRDVVEHDLTKMTPRMLEQAMDQYNVSGDTRRKAVGFFLRAAKFAEIPMHPLLMGQIRETGTGTRKKKAKSAKPNEPNGGGPSTQTFPPVVDASRKTIQLASGGAVTLEISANPFLMSASDRTFVFELIDKLHTYAGTEPATDEEEDAE